LVKRAAIGCNGTAGNVWPLTCTPAINDTNSQIILGHLNKADTNSKYISFDVINDVTAVRKSVVYFCLAFSVEMKCLVLVETSVFLNFIIPSKGTAPPQTHPIKFFESNLYLLNQNNTMHANAYSG